MSIDRLALLPGAEVVCNTIQLREGMKYVVLARMVGQEWQITEEGEHRLRLDDVEPEAPTVPAPKPAKVKPPRGRPVKVVDEASDLDFDL